MKTIIAATNFTEASNHAVAFAADVAYIIRARLVIFNIIDIQPATDVLFPSDFFDEAKEQSGKLLAALLLEMKKRTKDEIEIKTVYRIGTVVSQLEILGNHEAPFAVFIASQFIASFEPVLRDTHAISVVKHSAYPVVVVPANATMNGFKKVAIAADPDDDDAIQWPFLRDLLKIFNTELDIVAVSGNAELSSVEMPLSIDVQKQLNSFKVSYHFVANDDVEVGIRAYVTEHTPDLLIMFVRKHGIFHKSITKSFILLPPVPIMLISSKMK